MTRLEFQTAVEEILGVARGAMKDSDSRKSIETWSSIADVQIVALIASEFRIEPDSEMMEAETFGEVIRLLETKGAFLS